MKLKDKVQYALDESRMLIMGVQVLLGFNFQAFLTEKLGALPHAAKLLKLGATACLLLATLLLLLPVARHRLVERGNDSTALHTFTRRTAGAALLPFALALGIDAFIVACRIAGPMPATVLAALGTVATLVAWYVVPMFGRGGRPESRSEEKAKAMEEEASLKDKITHVLTEARVVLPGTQALLGFQFVAVLQDDFDTLPAVSRAVHLVGLGMLGASVVLLMMPAAYHRIAEDGEISERLHRFAGRTVIASMIALALGLGCDTFVVVGKGAGSLFVALVAALVWIVVSLGAWLGLMLVIRRRRTSGGAFSRHARAKAVFSGAE